MAYTLDGTAPQGFRIHAAVDLQQFWMLDSERGVLVGSSDGGKSWEILSTSPLLKRDIYSFHFSSPKLGWAKADGALLRTEDGGKTWSDLSEIQVKKAITQAVIMPIVRETQQGDYVLQVISVKNMYSLNEEVKITARLKYIGSKSKEMISHAASPFSFGVTEVKRNIGIPYIMNQPLITREMKKGQWHEESYMKTGGYGKEDPNLVFLKQFLEEPGFPDGTYKIQVNAHFDTGEGEQKLKHNLSTVIQVVVQ
ncbi:hypothetical protein D3C73_514240 [compost metagenome]